jgi:hypothetical protein
MCARWAKKNRTSICHASPLFEDFIASILLEIDNI